MSQLFASGGQSIGASTSFLLINIQEILISFRIDWFDLLAVQGTLKSLLQLVEACKVSIDILISSSSLVLFLAMSSLLMSPLFTSVSVSDF